MIRRILLLTLLAVMWVGFAKAQQATGPAAAKAKEEVLKLEKAKVPLLLKGGSYFADWFEQNDAEDVLIVGGTGYRRTRAEQVAIWRTGRMTQSYNNQHDHQAYAYDNGNVVVVTYIGETTNTVDGKTATDKTRAMEVWVKQDGKWLRIVHGGAAMKGEGSKASE